MTDLSRRQPAFSSPASCAPRPHALVIGLGNPFRGDDAVGWVVADGVRLRTGGGIRVVTDGRGGAGLLDLWNGADQVVIVDAASSGGRAGDVHRFDASCHPIPEVCFRSSTHSLGVSSAIELARALGRLPRRLLVFAVEGRTFTPGSALSPEVEIAARLVIESIVRECRVRAAV